MNIEAGLDSYFPFDPYDLPRSNEWIQPIYRTWAEVAIDDVAESESVSQESEEEDESLDTESVLEDRLSLGRSLPTVNIGSNGTARSRLMKDGGLSSSLEGMSLSPGLSAWI